MIMGKLSGLYNKRKRKGYTIKPTKETPEELLNFTSEFMAQINAYERGRYNKMYYK